jgi:hypothetical protein
MRGRELSAGLLKSLRGGDQQISGKVDGDALALPLTDHRIDHPLRSGVRQRGAPRADGRVERDRCAEPLRRGCR